MHSFSHHHQSSQLIEIYICCRSLKNDNSKSSNTFVSFNMKNLKTGLWNEIGRTELVRNSQNPNFRQTFKIDYNSTSKQKCQIVIFNQESNGDINFVGEIRTSIDEIINSRNSIKIIDLAEIPSPQQPSSSTNSPKVILIAEQINTSFQTPQEIYKLHWGAVQLFNSGGWFNKINPFLRFYKMKNDNIQLIIYETEVVMENLSPVWKPFDISSEKLNVMHDQNKQSQLIKVECWNWEKKNDKQAYLGEIFFTLDELTHGKRAFSLTNPKQKNPGEIKLLSFEKVIAQNSYSEQILNQRFINYIKDSVFLNIALAFDFSITSFKEGQESLEYQNSSSINCKQAVKAIWDIVHNCQQVKKISFNCYEEKRNAVNQEITILHQLDDLSLQHYNKVNSEKEIFKFISDSVIKQKQNNIQEFQCQLASTIIDIQQIQKMQHQQQVYNYLILFTNSDINDIITQITKTLPNQYIPLSILIIGFWQNKQVEVKPFQSNFFKKIEKGDSNTLPQLNLLQFEDLMNKSNNQQSQIQEDILHQIIKYLNLQGITPSSIPILSMSQIEIF